jgi:uncharacterized protein
MARMSRTERITFPAAPDGGGAAPLLSGRLRRPDGAPRGVAVLSHPHPAFGGNMDVWLLPRLAERLAAAGWLALRYDVRGVGASQPGPGRWDGATEHLDLAGAIDRAVAEVAPPAGAVSPAPGDAAALPLVVIGWSFGALLGLLHGPGDPRVGGWIGIAPPTRPVDGVAMALPDPARTAAWPATRTVVVGSHDQHFPPATVDVLAPHAVHVVPDADHFLFDRDDEVADLVLAALPSPGSATPVPEEPRA